MPSLSQKVYKLLDELVRMNSISYAGQRETANFLYERIRSSPYFEKRMDAVLKVFTDLPDSPFSILALYESPKNLRQTIILCGHFDTVGIEEFGKRPAVAFNQEELIPWLRTRFQDDSELLNQIESGDYYFGRGALDMKGAVGMLTETFIAISEKSVPSPADAFQWNLILLLTCDEEGTGAGIRSALPYLIKLRDEAKLDFRLLINADFAHATENDPVPIFCGTIGKVLVGISVFGTETHAGSPFEGVNASALLSAIISHLECNPKLTQHVKGEFTPPPTVLSATGTQHEYSVKTPSEAHAYINLFFMHPRADRLMGKVVNEVRRACKLHLRGLKKKYNTFVAKQDTKVEHAILSATVLDFASLMKMVTEKVSSPSASQLYSIQHPFKDKLFELGNLYEQLQKAYPIPRPSVIVSFLPPVYAPYAMRLDSTQRETFETLRDFTRNYREAKLNVSQFYPFISDMSFLHPLKPEKAREFELRMPIPDVYLSSKGRSPLTIPTINIGPIGRGAHSVKERVHLPTLLEKLPPAYLALLSKLSGNAVKI